MTLCEIIGERHYGRQIEVTDACLEFIGKAKTFIEERIGDPTKKDEIKRAQEMMSVAIKECTNTANSLSEYTEIIDSINKTRLDRVYFEGLENVRDEDPAYYAAQQKGLKIVYLDEGIDLHSLLTLEKMIIDEETGKPEYEQLMNMRENAWAEKIKENGDGLVIVGSTHSQSLAEKLNKSGIFTNILYTL
jgi:hypothetical protein